jgi:DNA-binding GntR family transcriptional regulator
LAARIETMEQARLAPVPNLKLYRQANEDFHWEILQHSGNHTLDFTVRAAARWPIVGPTFSGWNAIELARSQDHHREALAAFEIRDGVWAEAVMSVHLHAALAAYRRVAEAAAGHGDEEPSQRGDNERDRG